MHFSVSFALEYRTPSTFLVVNGKRVVYSYNTRKREMSLKGRMRNGKSGKCESKLK